MKMRRVWSVSLVAAGALLVEASCGGGGSPRTSTGGAGTSPSGSAGTTGTPGAAGTGAAGTDSSGAGGSGAAGTDSTGAAGTGSGAGGTAAGGAGTGAAGTAPASDGGTPPPPRDGGGGVVPKGPSAGCNMPLPAGDGPSKWTQHKVMVVGVAATVKPVTAGGSWTDRVYYLDLPANYDPSKPYPILFGGGGCGGSLISNGNNGGFGVLPTNNSSAIQVGLSYVWPQGGGACFAENGADNPDLPYFDSVLKEVEDHFCVDKGKVFVGGYSSGGWLSYMLAFARGGVVRGISPAAGGLHPMASRPPDSNIPTAGLLLTGGADTANPATGPTGSDAARDLMLKINGCVGTDTVAWETPCAGCACNRYTGCPAAYPVVRCRPPGQGHTDGGGAFKTAIWATWSTLPAP